MNPKHIADSAAGSDIQLTKQEWYDLYLAAGNDLHDELKKHKEKELDKI